MASRHLPHASSRLRSGFQCAGAREKPRGPGPCPALLLLSLLPRAVQLHPLSLNSRDNEWARAPGPAPPRPRPARIRCIKNRNRCTQRQCVSVRCGPWCRRDTALAAAAMYQSMFGDEDGSIPATYQVRSACAVPTAWFHPSAHPVGLRAQAHMARLPGHVPDAKGAALVPWGCPAAPNPDRSEKEGLGSTESFNLKPLTINPKLDLLNPPLFKLQVLPGRHSNYVCCYCQCA